MRSPDDLYAHWSFRSAGLAHLQKKFLMDRIFSVWGRMLCSSTSKSWQNEQAVNNGKICKIDNISTAI